MRYIIGCSCCLLLLGCTAKSTPLPPSQAPSTSVFGISAESTHKTVEKHWQYQDSVERAKPSSETTSASKDVPKAKTNIEKATMVSTVPLATKLTAAPVAGGQHL